MLVVGCWSSRHHTDIPRVVKRHTDSNTTRTTNITHTCTYTFSHIYKHPRSAPHHHIQHATHTHLSHHMDEVNCPSPFCQSIPSYPSSLPLSLFFYISLDPLLSFVHRIQLIPTRLFPLPPTSLLPMSLSQVKRAIQQQREHPKKREKGQRSSQCRADLLVQNDAG